MRVGSIVFATESGLGLLAKSFHDHGIVTDVLVAIHPHYANYPQWYPSRHIEEEEFLDRIDVLLLFETALNLCVVKRARKRGIPIALMPMYEWTPNPFPCTVDLYLCPSLLDLRYYAHMPSIFLPVPVELPWRQRSVAQHFVHNAGHGGTNYRNGTPELLEAMQHVKSPIQLTVRGQPGIATGGRAAPSENRIVRLFHDFQSKHHDARITFQLGSLPQDKLWAEGDVFVFPEKFNGLSLPLQEAYASGMLVMASNRFPMTTWLPGPPLIPVRSYAQDRIAVDFERAVIDPFDIAATIDKWYGQEITDYSLAGRCWADDHSWEALKPRYLQLLGSLCA